MSFHLLLSEFDIPELWLQLIHSSLKYQGVECRNLQGVSCWPRLRCGITFPTLCFTLEHLIGLREQLIVGCFPELVFQFSMVQVLVGLCEQFVNNFVFISWACSAGFNNNNNNINNNNDKIYHPGSGHREMGEPYKFPLKHGASSIYKYPSNIHTFMHSIWHLG